MEFGHEKDVVVRLVPRVVRLCGAVGVRSKVL